MPDFPKSLIKHNPIPTALEIEQTRQHLDWLEQHAQQPTNSTVSIGCQDADEADEYEAMFKHWNISYERVETDHRQPLPSSPFEPTKIGSLYQPGKKISFLISHNAWQELKASEVL